MSELLDTLKGIRIKTRQISDENSDNFLKLAMKLPKRRHNINVTGTIQDSSDQGYSSASRTARSD